MECLGTFKFGKEGSDDRFANHLCLATEDNRDRFGHLSRLLNIGKLKRSLRKRYNPGSADSGG
jgi:hypothetical protein